MALADHLHKAPPKGLDGILAALDAEDRRVLEQALADPAYRHVDIANALAAIGHLVSDDLVRKYRRRLAQKEST